jgi:hypothetical protein
MPDFVGEPDENCLGAPDVTEPISVFVLNHLANALHAEFAEPRERIVDVLYSEHDPQVTKSVH